MSTTMDSQTINACLEALAAWGRTGEDEENARDAVARLEAVAAEALGGDVAPTAVDGFEWTRGARSMERGWNVWGICWSLASGRYPQFVYHSSGPFRVGAWFKGRGEDAGWEVGIRLYATGRDRGTLVDPFLQRLHDVVEPGTILETCRNVANSEHAGSIVVAKIPPTDTDWMSSLKTAGQKVRALLEAAFSNASVLADFTAMAAQYRKYDQTRSLEAAPLADDARLRRDSPEFVSSIHRHLSERLCVVLEGPPGTGKTYAALELVRRMANGDFDVAKGGARSEQSESTTKSAVEACQWSALRQTEPGVKPALPTVGKVVWELVQMHPGYAYEDFVRGLETDPSKQGVHFTPVDRIVLELAEVARLNPGTTVVLIMDEINRCNLSSVLGELILALEKDKRGRPIRLQYGGSATIPANLWFIGTMNTADRSIAHIDYAIRRRFRFIDIPPDPGALTSYYRSGRKAQRDRAIAVMEALNRQIGPRNLHVGPAYFMEEGEGEDWTRRMADRLVYEVLPLLREYVAEDRKVLGNGGRVVELLGAKFDLDAAEVDPTAAPKVFELGTPEK